MGRKINESSIKKQSGDKDREREKVRGKQKRENCKFSALYARLHSTPQCTTSLFVPSFWVVMRGLWCWKWTELKLYNEQFHLNQVQSHLLIRSDPHTILDYFWSWWLVEDATFKFLHENCASLLTTNPPWKFALIHEKEEWCVLTTSFNAFLLCTVGSGYCSGVHKRDNK